MLLSLADVSKSFGTLRAAEAIHLDIEAGSAVGIIGPNGAGKSTLFNLITGSFFPDSGTIMLGGRDITYIPPFERCAAGIGRCYQIPQPFEGLTTFENLLIGAAYGRNAREAEVVDSCAEILEQTGLLPLANRPAGLLTLLERKRLELARALATGPEVLLLDEIAAGLTEGECATLVETIQTIHRSGMTILWIEHIVHALMAVVDRLVVLNFGRMIAEGAPKPVMASAEVQEIYMGIAV